MIIKCLRKFDKIRLTKKENEIRIIRCVYREKRKIIINVYVFLI